MTLAEKILALRTERSLSQGDLAEKLDVSRQSVSKWETGQSVPELDKIIRLADVFGVSVDQLVREGDPPNPAVETPPAAQPQIVYVERPGRRLTAVQILGVALLALGLLSVILGAAVSGSSGTYTAMAGAGMVVLGLPLLLARKHPFTATGWVVLMISCLILNPYTSVSPWGLRGGIFYLYLYLTRPEMHDSTNLFAALVGISRGLFFLVLAVYTGRLCWKRWKKRKPEEQEQKTE